MVFLEPGTPERDWILIHETSLVQGVPWVGVGGCSSCGYHSWVALIYCPWELWLRAKWGMGDRLCAREWGQGLPKHHLQPSHLSSFPTLSPRVDTFW